MILLESKDPPGNPARGVTLNIPSNANIAKYTVDTHNSQWNLRAIRNTLVHNGASPEMIHYKLQGKSTHPGYCSAECIHVHTCSDSPCSLHKMGYLGGYLGGGTHGETGLQTKALLVVKAVLWVVEVRVCAVVVALGVGAVDVRVGRGGFGGRR